MANFIDQTVIRATLAARPQLRDNLRALVGHVTNGAFDARTLMIIERNLVASISVSEVLIMPTEMPRADAKLELTSPQFKVLERVVSRLKDPKLRDRVKHELATAVAAGRLAVR